MRPPGYLNSRHPRPAEILWAVSQITGIDQRSILDRSRRPPIVEARWMLFWVGHRRLGYPKLQLARFSRVHHTTVMNGVRRVEARMVEFEPWLEWVERLLAEPIATAA